MLYTASENDDYANVLAAIDGFTKGLGLPPMSVDLDEIANILRGMRHDFPAQGGSVMASPFKKAANFLCYFVTQGPVKDQFPVGIVGQEIVAIRGHQNVMVGLHIAIDALHGATISRVDGDIVLSNRIALSKHSYIDTIQACSSIAPQTHFHLVSGLLEQMCYRVNPDASYPMAI